MEDRNCTVTVKVLNHWLIQRFDGEAMVASASPRFVVALLILDTKSAFLVPQSEVQLSTHRVAFFAIDSLAKVFAETNIVGNQYRLSVRELSIGDSKRFVLTVTEAVSN